MRISWVISEDITDNALDMKVVKETSSSWGSWKVWKKYKVDNCVCTDTSEATKLIQRAFHAVCNFYMMQESFTKVGSPVGVKLFDGKFKSDYIDNKDDIVALNIAAPGHDIVLLSGFNLSPMMEDDEVKNVSREEYYYNIKELIKSNSTTQFVFVDYKHEISQWIRELDNVTFDTISSVKSLLS